MDNVQWGRPGFEPAHRKDSESFEFDHSEIPTEPGELDETKASLDGCGLAIELFVVALLVLVGAVWAWKSGYLAWVVA